MISINGARALQLLEAAVASRGPDYKYGDHFDPANCDYVAASVGDPYRPVPACLIGQALTEAGVSLNDLNELSEGLPDLVGFYEVFGSAGVDSVFVPGDVDSDELAPIGVELDAVAVHIWTIAQRAQDNNDTWGQALERARQAAEQLAVSA